MYKSKFRQNIKTKDKAVTISPNEKAMETEGGNHLSWEKLQSGLDE